MQWLTKKNRLTFAALSDMTHIGHYLNAGNTIRPFGALSFISGPLEPAKGLAWTPSVGRYRCPCDDRSFIY